MSGALVEGIRDRLREIDRERDHLLALLQLYEQGPTSNGAKAPSTAGTASSAKGPAPFRAIAGGPTDRIMAVVTREPGLAYSEIIERAVQGITSGAEDPRKSLGSTLQSLVKRGKLERREGRHYPAK
jgi:hypothetical protein